jgi:hypothetical protein
VVLSVTLLTGSVNVVAAGGRSSSGGCCAGVNVFMVAFELESFDKLLINITSVKPTIRNVKNMKTAMKSVGIPRPLSTIVPPSITPNPQMAIKVIAVRNDAMGPVLLDSVFSLRLLPQRLQ